MTTTILIGNGVSLIAAVFTVLSTLSRGRKKIYTMQTIQCLLCAVAALFFGSYSGIVTLFLCAARNALLAMGRLTKTLTIVFLVLTIGLGLYFNNRGILGLLPIAASTQYTLGSYLTRKDRTIKVNIFVNLVLWSVYDILILDIVTFIVDTVSAVSAVIGFIRDGKARGNNSPPVGSDSSDPGQVS